MRSHVLIVDDDAELCALLKDSLAQDGYRTQAVRSADKALAAVQLRRPDIFIVDIGLPGFSGLDLCRHLKRGKETAPIPLILLTSRTAERSRIEGLDAGADDYVTKPFSMGELRARIRAALRRARGLAPDSVLQAGDVVVNLDTHVVQVRGKTIALRPKEFALLVALLGRKGRVLTRRFLTETVWAPHGMATSHTISVSIAGLRDKLGPAGRHIVTVTGVGYKFEYP